MGKKMAAVPAYSDCTSRTKKAGWISDRSTTESEFHPAITPNGRQRTCCVCCNLSQDGGWNPLPASDGRRLERQSLESISWAFALIAAVPDIDCNSRQSFNNASDLA